MLVAVNEIRRWRTVGTVTRLFLTEKMSYYDRPNDYERGPYDRPLKRPRSRSPPRVDSYVPSYDRDGYIPGPRQAASDRDVYANQVYLNPQHGGFV